jgi:hypothetical protein
MTERTHMLTKEQIERLDNGTPVTQSGRTLQLMISASDWEKLRAQALLALDLQAKLDAAQKENYALRKLSSYADHSRFRDSLEYSRDKCSCGYNSARQTCYDSARIGEVPKL